MFQVIFIVRSSLGGGLTPYIINQLQKTSHCSGFRLRNHFFLLTLFDYRSGGYSDDGHGKLVGRGISESGSTQQTPSRSDRRLPPQRLRSALRAVGSGGTIGSGGISAGRSSQHSKASSVRFLDESVEDGDDDTRSVMSGFEHRYSRVSCGTEHRM